jgi:hypothetical protein
MITGAGIVIILVVPFGQISNSFRNDLKKISGIICCLVEKSFQVYKLLDCREDYADVVYIFLSAK